MKEIVMHLFFYGAIAFVPNSSVNPDEMAAYLIKPHHFEHIPFLYFKTLGNTSCPVVEACSTTQTFCSRFDTGASTPDLCICLLKEVDLKFVPPTDLERRFLRPGPSKTRPREKKDTYDLAWLARLSNIDRGACKIKPWGEAKALVNARLRFGWSEAFSCHLDQRFDEYASEYQIHALEFVENEYRKNVKPDYEQAVTEYAMFVSRFSDWPRARPIRLRLNERSGGVLNIDFDCSSGTCPDLFVGNLTKEYYEDEDFGEHFIDYYHLSENPPEPKKELIPHITDKAFPVGEKQLYTCGGAPLTDLSEFLATRFPPILRPIDRPSKLPARSCEDIVFSELSQAVTTAVSSRVICPMALFEP